MQTANVTLEKVDWTDKLVLRNLVSLYLYDFSEIVEVPITSHGTFEYGQIDHYWTDDNRLVYFVKAEGSLAGFVMINKGDGEEKTHSIAEFFILRGYRRKGVGTQAAHQVFKSLHGAWRIHEMPQNKAAQNFWRRVIGEFTDGQFTEAWSEAENRLVQRFMSK